MSFKQFFLQNSGKMHLIWILILLISLRLTYLGIQSGEILTILSALAGYAVVYIITTYGEKVVGEKQDRE